MHWPVAFQPGKGREIELERVDIIETWWAMEDLVREGLVRQIGISNFNQREVERLLRHARIPPSVHEFETHPYLSQSEFVKLNLQHGLRVIAFSPLGNMNPIYESSSPPLLKDDFLTSIAQKKGITVAQLVLAWSMHRGVIVIPKSDHEERVAENWEAQRVVLTDDEVASITAYDKKLRFNNPSTEWGTELYTGLDGI
jgi:amidase